MQSEDILFKGDQKRKPTEECIDHQFTALANSFLLNFTNDILKVIYNIYNQKCPDKAEDLATDFHTPWLLIET